MSVSMTPVPAPRLSGESPDPAEPPRRGPLTAVEQRDLEAIRFAWAEFDVGFAGGEFWALRLATGNLLSGATTDELAAAILRDWGSR